MPSTQVLVFISSSLAAHGATKAMGISSVTFYLAELLRTWHRSTGESNLPCRGKDLLSQLCLARSMRANHLNSQLFTCTYYIGYITSVRIVFAKTIYKCIPPDSKILQLDVSPLRSSTEFINVHKVRYDLYCADSWSLVLNDRGWLASHTGYPQ